MSQKYLSRLEKLEKVTSCFNALYYRIPVNVKTFNLFYKIMFTKSKAYIKKV